MKNAVSILMLILFANFSQAQNNDYSSLWNKVAKFEIEGLPKSALEIVDQIIEESKKENNNSQRIKSLLYKSKYAITLEEDAQLKIVNDFKNEISQSVAPTKNILENLLANMYWQFFQQNRYQFYNRTKTESIIDTEDFRTWDLQTLFEEIHIHFQNSLENGLLLQQTNIEDFKTILSKQKKSKLYRPTIYDLLSHNALEFYKTDETSITQPTYKFEIDKVEYMDAPKAFIMSNLISKDSMSLQLHALKIYQRLIQFHLRDEKPDALVDVDIARLKFVLQHATLENKETLYLNNLKASVITYDTHPASALFNYEIAQLYYKKGIGFNPTTNSEARWKIKDALELCNSTIIKFPNSSGAEKCIALKSQINQYSLNLVAEGSVPIQDYSRVLVSYKNINGLKFKLFKVNLEQINNFNTSYKPEEKLAFISKLKVYEQWESNLKNEKDYQLHATEIVIPELDNGHYLLYSEANNVHKTFATTIIQATDIAIVEKSTQSEIIYQVINRGNGKPFVGASVKLKYQTKYNGSFKHKNLISNTHGEVSISKTSDRYINVSLNVSINDDKAHFGNYHINRFNYRNNNDKKQKHNAFLFTDRSIYRPGQTVYFKGIAMSAINGRSTVSSKIGTRVKLYNSNRETVKEITLKTNEFGSVSGEFILPNDGLNGLYTIEFFAGVTAATKFSVEEYKRPKFESSFNPITQTFKVNDTITIKGHALAYAGSNITDAKVVYRVKRKVRYPDWYYWYRPWFSSEPQEITNGEGITNAKGEFEIRFKSIPDESVDKSSLPVFHYEVTADITDLNGETRSAITVVNVGYHALTASILLDHKLDKTKKDHKLTIETNNLNGESVSAKGSVKIYKLISPNNVLRTRPWNAPDYQVISKEEFKTKFPHDGYSNEHLSANWDKGALVLNKTFDTEKSKELSLGNIKKWNSGQYIILLESKDKFGQLVKAETKTMVYSNDDKTLADHQLFSISTDKNWYSANDKVLLTLGSASKNLTVTLEVEKKS